MMKKGSFDLTGKAVDCRELQAMGGAGKEIFRALKVALNLSMEYTFKDLEFFPYIVLTDKNKVVAGSNLAKGREKIQPSDVLGQAAINAAKDGATLVFEGDEIPSNQYGIKSYYEDGEVIEWREKQEEDLIINGSSDGEDPIIAYKLLGEMEILSNHPKANDAIANDRVLVEKVGSKHSHYFKDVSNLDTIDVYRICDLCEVNDSSGATQHAVKKLLCAGQRGAKDKRKDLEEARDTIIRKLAMMDEDEG
tara:strand:- start:26872 stop:27621 length:750 start_codon:yes stop_codon:yes gene_type:complete